jgi:hypothetical protein
MARFAPLPLAVTVAVALAGACSPAPNQTFTRPQASKSASTPIGAASATTKPSAAPSLAGPAASCVPVLSAESGVVQAAQLRSYAAFPGLNVQGSGTTAEVYDPDVIMTLQAFPGSAEVALAKASVVFTVDGKTTAAQTVDLHPTTLPAGTGVAFGTQTAVTVRLPTAAMVPLLDSDPRSQTATAAVTFLNAAGATVTNETFQPFVVTLPLQMGPAPTPIKTPGPNQCVSGASVYRTPTR